MSKTELRAAMRALHLTVRGLAQLVEVSPSTVTRWRKGTRRVPGGVARYLELRLRVAALSL